MLQHYEEVFIKRWCRTDSDGSTVIWEFCHSEGIPNCCSAKCKAALSKAMICPAVHSVNKIVYAFFSPERNFFFRATVDIWRVTFYLLQLWQFRGEVGWLNESLM